MKSSIVSLVVFAAVSCFASLASAEPLPVKQPSFADMLRMAAFKARGDATLPAAWAGVWNFEDDDYDCTTNDFLNSDTNVDTLCTGEQLDPSDFGIEMDCTVTTLNDTDIDIDCSGIYDPGFPPGCTITIGFSLVAHRSGDALTATAVFSQDYATACLVADDCIRTETVGTRIGPEPPNCLTAVEPETWGRVKALYR